MNRLRNLIVCLCPALLLAVGLAHAETVFWSDNFDTNGASRWSVSATGVWKIGSPNVGPPPVSGFRTHSGADCAFTAGYAYNKDSRLVCVNYNGASSLLVPSADQSPRLRFWQWFNFENALGYVEISTNRGVSWTQISPTYENINGGGVWSRPSIILSAYAGQNVLLAFHFTSGGCCGNALGWFVDDVAVVTGAPVLNFPENFAAGEGDWSVDFGTWQVGLPTSGPGGALRPATNCAATVLAGDYAYNVDSRLISPPFQVPASGSPALSFSHWYSFNNALGFVEINNGAATITIQTNTTSATNTIATLNTNSYQFFGSTDPNYATPFYWNPTIGGWTNSLGKALGSVYDGTYSQFYFEAGNAPLASVGGSNGEGGENDDYLPLDNTIIPLPPSTAPTNFFAIQGLTWAPVNDIDTADNPIGYFGTNYTYSGSNGVTYTTNEITWIQLSPTYENSTSGGIWTNVSLDLSAYAGDTVQIAFHFSSGGIYTAPGWYVDDISLTGPPQLLVTNQTIYAGETLTVTNIATNSILPNAIYTFKLLSAPANVSMTTNGVLTWATTIAQLPSTNTIIVKATDNSIPPLSATNSFLVFVLNPWLPMLTVPPSQAVFAGQTLVLTSSATNYFFTSDSFTLSLVSPLLDGMDDSDLPTEGVLTWATQPTQHGPYTIVIEATDNDPPYLNATNSFVIVVSNAVPPTLTVPGRQVIYAGQQWTGSISASSVYGTNSSFTLYLLSAFPPGMVASDQTTNEVLIWDTPTNEPAKNYTIKFKVVDSVSQLSATNSFVIAVSNAFPPKLTVPGRQVVYAGQKRTFTNTASSVYGTNSSFTYYLVSVLRTNMDTSALATNGVLRWNTSTNQPAGNFTTTIRVVDGVSQLSATNSFVIAVSNASPPTLTVPGRQVVYAGQTRTFTNTASSVYGTNSSFTYRLLPGGAPGMDTSGLTNVGVLRLVTAIGQTLGTYTNKVKVVDSVSQLSATNSFVIVVSNPIAPSLLVPSTQVIYAGWTLTVTNYATSVYPYSTFTFALLPPAPTGVNLATDTGVLTWDTTVAQAAGNYTNFIMVVDSVSGLSAVNHFVTTILTNPPAPPQILQPVIGSNGFTFTLVAQTNSVWRIDVSSNLLDWQPVSTNTADSGYLQFTDPLATKFLQRFYRAAFEVP